MAGVASFASEGVPGRHVGILRMRIQGDCGQSGAEDCAPYPL